MMSVGTFLGCRVGTNERYKGYGCSHSVLSSYCGYSDWRERKAIVRIIVYKVDFAKERCLYCGKKER